MFNFEKLEVWKKAIDFADLLYSLTQGLPAEERFGLTVQIRRAAVSVSSNIAEGSSRNSKIDFARFLEIAEGSLFEVISQTAIALRLGFISEEDNQKVYRAADEQSRMQSGLRRHLLGSGTN